MWISVPVSLQLIARYRLSAGHRTTPTKFEGVVARGQAWGRQRVQRLCLESPEPRHHLQQGPHRRAPALRLAHRSLELLSQGPDLRKVHPQSQA